MEGRTPWALSLWRVLLLNSSKEGRSDFSANMTAPPLKIIFYANG